MSYSAAILPIAPTNSLVPCAACPGSCASRPESRARLAARLRRQDRIRIQSEARLEGSLLHPDEAHLFWNGAFSAEQKRAIARRTQLSAHPLIAVCDALPAASEIGFLNRYMFADQLAYLPDDLLVKVDRMSMAHSLEVRPPLLDHRIVEFAARLPERLKIRGAYQKAILSAR